MTNHILDELYSLMKNPPDESTWRRFCNYINPTSWTDCWEWQGARHGKGYGHFSFRCQTRKAHRQMAVWTLPRVMNDQVMDHLWCDNPPCVNPLHLIPATNRDNILRGTRNPCAIKARATHCKRGHLYEGQILPPSRTGRRWCIICAYRKAKEYSRSKRF